MIIEATSALGTMMHQLCTCLTSGYVCTLYLYRMCTVLYAGRYQPGSYYGAERGEYLPESWAKLVTYRLVSAVKQLNILLADMYQQRVKQHTLVDSIRHHAILP
jgi:hypothetical protein